MGTPEYTLVGRPFVGQTRVRLQVEEQAKDAKVSQRVMCVCARAGVGGLYLCVLGGGMGVGKDILDCACLSHRHHRHHHDESRQPNKQTKQPTKQTASQPANQPTNQTR